MMLDQNHAMVILSGGQDSTTCLGIACEKYRDVSVITFNYGQSHSRELEAARDVRRYFEEHTGRHIRHHFVVVPDILVSTSPLTNSGNGLATYNDNAQMEAEVGDRVESTFVPMRNMFFLVVAANRAISVNAGTLVTGVCEEDNANYPDCRSSFINATFLAINESLGSYASSEMRIDTPLIHMTKAQSILKAVATPYTYEALAYSHTAYDGHYPPTGHDHASILRAHGFELAGLPDPLVMRAAADGLMDLPDTPNYSGEAISLVEAHLNRAGI